MAKCVKCNSRKGKRNCPALGSVVCSQCCGTKREKEIDCPGDCFYLGKSKQYFTDRQEAGKISEFEKQMKSVEGNEDEYLDVLQNIEFAISQTYNNNKDINDRHVETALDYIMEMGKVQMDIPSKFLTAPEPNVQTIIDTVEDILKFRETFANKEEDMITKLKCIYRILDSVRTHYSQKDSHSYLRFIGQFIV